MSLAQWVVGWLGARVAGQLAADRLCIWLCNFLAEKQSQRAIYVVYLRLFISRGQVTGCALAPPPSTSAADYCHPWYERLPQPSIMFAVVNAIRITLRLHFSK